MHRSLIRSTQNSNRTLSNILIQQYQRNRLASASRYYSSRAIPINNNEVTSISPPTVSISTLNERQTANGLGNEHLQPNTPDQLTKKVKQITISTSSPELCFNVLLEHIRLKEPKKALNALVEMVNEGVQFSIENYNILLGRLATNTGASIQTKIVQLMEQQQVPLTAISHQYVLKGMSRNQAPGRLMEYLETMKKQDFKPTLSSYGDIISSCLYANEPTTAFRLMKEAETAELPLKLNPRLMMDVLRVSALNDQIEETRYSWNKVVNEFELRPDEGSCLLVLGVAAKSGDSNLATQVIQQLSNSGFSYKEHYFVPLMEAFAVKDELKSVFDVLDIMRVSGVVPTARSTYTISNKISSNVETVDKAYYILEEMKKEGKRVDVAAFNIVVSACGLAKDMGRTVVTYQEASNLGVTPDIDTFNAVLEACIQTETKGMGQVVFDELKKANVTPNVDTFSKMISLVCRQSNYEDAFVYLEEMKTHGITPPRESYFVLAKKLAREKDTRFHLALEEMETYGVKPSAYLKSLWK